MRVPHGLLLSFLSRKRSGSIAEDPQSTEIRRERISRPGIITGRETQKETTTEREAKERRNTLKEPTKTGREKHTRNIHQM